MRRDLRRDELLARIPSWYSGPLHGLLVLLSGLATIAGCVAWLARPAPWMLLLAAATLLLANVFEWWVHRGPLHRRWPGLGALYDRHTRAHHVVFVAGDMAIREARELRFVLFPAWVFPVFLAMNVPALALAAWLGGRDAGLVFLASAVTYYLIYEVLHTLHHAPATLGRGRLASRLRRHHERHHEPARMLLGNWNVSFPLADLVLGTTLGDAPIVGPVEDVAT